LDSIVVGFSRVAAAFDASESLGGIINAEIYRLLRKYFQCFDGGVQSFLRWSGRNKDNQ